MTRQSHPRRSSLKDAVERTAYRIRRETIAAILLLAQKSEAAEKDVIGKAAVRRFASRVREFGEDAMRA